jgi:CheY-like chemotaxis protein
LDSVLRQNGFVVRLATNGRQAVEIYREHHKSIALVLLDVQMPGIDGPSTLAAIQAINPEVQCCFMSGNTGKYSAEELLGLGAARVLPKPFASMSLLAHSLWETLVTDRCAGSVKFFESPIPPARRRIERYVAAGASD